MMKPFESVLQRACVDDFADSVLEAEAGYRVISVFVAKEFKLPGWVAAALQHVSGLEEVHAQAGLLT
eukprot:2200821-Amphidinium_carterae.1